MVTVLNLGGTIDLDYRRGAPVQGGLRKILPDGVRLIELDPVQGNNLTWRHLCALRARLVESSGEYQWFLVTVGTDVLEEVVYFVSIVKPPTAAVVVVGSFAPPADAASTASYSLTAAMRWLQQSGAGGVAVCSDGEILEGALVEKICLDSWRFRPRQVSDEVLPPWRLGARAKLSSLPPRVPVLTIGIDSVGWIRDALRHAKADGIIVSAYGSGDVPERLVPVLRKLVGQGLPVVLASRSHPGIVQPAFPGVPGASHELLQAGVLGGGALDASLLRIRLVVALAARPSVPLATVFHSGLT